MEFNLFIVNNCKCKHYFLILLSEAKYDERCLHSAAACNIYYFCTLLAAIYNKLSCAFHKSYRFALLCC